MNLKIYITDFEIDISRCPLFLMGKTGYLVKFDMFQGARLSQTCKEFHSADFHAFDSVDVIFYKFIQPPLAPLEHEKKKRSVWTAMNCRRKHKHKDTITICGKVNF